MKSDLDMADTWLRENDSYYKDKRKNKKLEEAYPYETEGQLKRREGKEIAFSNLKGKSIYKLRDYNVDIDNYLP